MTTISRRTVLLAAAACTFIPAASGKPRIDTASGRTLMHRGDERFAMCSTFKLPLAAAILQRADQSKLKLDTVVAYGKADMVPYAPVTEKNLAKGGMTIRELVEAAQTTSDNVAANLLLKQIGGPAGFTQFFRDIGDEVTRLDRFEPDMNGGGVANDERDTTTPAAMAATVAKVFKSGLLADDSRALLMQWMIDTKTGLKRVRAGLPQDWKAGDKTGTAMDGKFGKYNDVAVAWHSDHAPIVVASYFNVPQTSDAIEDRYQAVHAEVGRIAAAWAG